MIPEQRKFDILQLVDRYNRDDSKGVPMSPFIAWHHGMLGEVAEQIGVPVAELDEFLTIMDTPRELPYDHLMG